MLISTPFRLPVSACNRRAARCRKFRSLSGRNAWQRFGQHYGTIIARRKAQTVAMIVETEQTFANRW